MQFSASVCSWQPRRRRGTVSAWNLLGYLGGPLAAVHFPKIAQSIPPANSNPSGLAVVSISTKACFSPGKLRSLRAGIQTDAAS